ncbi:cation:proton antiporter subunit C [Rhodococcus triatomae]|uniref:Multicomponent Na+:H+ antiporter subunit C n=1 Tax=Rhodococcus triatomae TaxID=300028 RepID=A0A1G8IJE4_9NOCA|nr:cation:proton antiporter subunit C [Rhodococcus triatomae]QNG21071.1 cation:proton antiporter subunit C [Rhodococcus triatomae]QNG23015.1 cation:proton antiporter subunit C [Rhodococcus triatomae]SDI18942.1 multicomponent Na+:H+ antiporter subunit C [Rhodococcus triatomae]
MTLALLVGVLVVGGVYLVLQRGMVRITFGFVLLGHAGNLVLMASGVTSDRDAPLVHLSDLASMADALPQAFTLTAIVIAFSITIYMLTLAAVDDGTDDDDTVPDPDPDTGPGPDSPGPAGRDEETS